MLIDLCGQVNVLATITIYSENAAYQSIETLKTNRNKRYRQRSFYVEGVLGINAAERYGWSFKAFVYDGGKKLSGWARDMINRNQSADLYVLKSALMNKLSSKNDASELIAIVGMRDDEAPTANTGGSKRQDASPVYVLFDRPSGKGNLGTLLRSCDAFGVKALFITGHSVDIYDPEVIASSTGSFFAVPFAHIATSDETDKLIERLRQAHAGLSVIGTSAHAEIGVYDANLKKPLLILVGNEKDGLSWRLKQISDMMVTIPMAEKSFATSLNVSCAATVILNEAFRQRRQI